MCRKLLNMIFNRTHILLFLLLISIEIFSQAGRGVYKFLDLPVSSRLAALGSTNVSLRDNDLNFAFQNPSLLTPELHNTIAINISNYLADITFGSAMYSRKIDEKNILSAGIQYIDYGQFRLTNEFDTYENDIIQYFGAKDKALNFVYSRVLNQQWSAGATLKLIASNYESYSSYGFATDWGVSYNNIEKLFSAGLVFRNLGSQVKGYYSDIDGQHFEPLAFDIQLGVSKKFTHAPFRFSATLHNLQRWDLSYASNIDNTPIFSVNAQTKDEISFFDMAMRHAIVGVEFLPSKNFYVIASYNHRRSREMTMPGFKSMAGFSFGAGIKLSKFQVGFGMSQFQVQNFNYQFSLSTSLSEFEF